MTPKNKALELYRKYYFRQPKKEDIVMNANSKLYANIAVDEILNIEFIKNASMEFYDIRSYWREVKQEIEKL